MSDKMISQEYANDLIFELEKAIWDERGKGARFRVTTVGRGFFRENVFPKLTSTEIADMVRVVEGALCEKGIVSRVEASQDGRQLKVRVEGCVHRAIEEKMVAHETKPFTCMPANLIVLAIEEKLDRPAELAEIKLVEGACQVLIVLFDKRPFLG